MPKKNSVPDYTRRAIDKYHMKFDRIVISLPLGSKDYIKSTGKTFNQFFNELFQKYKQETQTDTETEKEYDIEYPFS